MPKIISQIGSERATSGAGNKIITHDGRTHVVWQDVTSEGYFNRVCTFDHDTGAWSRPLTFNKGRDNHARPIITVDHQGYLQAVMSGHNSPVTYRRSVRPNDAGEWTEGQPAGSGTYPVVVCGLDDTLYLTLRSPNRWDGVDFYSKSRDGAWEARGKLVKRREDYTGYGAFQTGMAIGADGVIHLVIDFYEGTGIRDQRGLHQAVCYMCSRDGGETWEKADGTRIKLPARPEQLDILVRSEEDERHEPMPRPEVLSQGCIVVSSQEPHILYISHLDKPGEIVHAWPDEKGIWQRESIDAGFPDHRPTGCRGAFSMDEAGTLYALLELQPLGKGWNNGKPTRGLNWETEDKRLIWLILQEGDRDWKTQLALPQDAIFNEANLERPTGANTISAGLYPPFVFFDGESRYPDKETDEVINNRVFFCGPKS